MSAIFVIIVVLFGCALFAFLIFDWVKCKNSFLEKEIEGLRERLHVLETTSAAPENASRQAEIAKRSGLALWLVLVIVASMIGAIYVYSQFSTDKAGAISDFLAYIFPCVAGVAAGLGLYRRNSSPELWFWASGILIIAGIVSYFISRSDTIMVWWASYGFIGVLMGSTLLFIDIRKRGWLGLRFFISINRMFRFTLFLGSIAVLILALVYIQLNKPGATWRTLGPHTRQAAEAVLWIGKELKW